MENKPVNVGGRPSAITPLILNKLVAALQRGFSNLEACEFAGITEPTFYKYMKQGWFFKQITDAKNYGKMLAGETIFDVLQDIERVRYNEKLGIITKKGKYSPRDRIETAKWYLEKKSPEFASKELDKPNGNGNTYNQYNFFTTEQLKEVTDNTGINQVPAAELLKINADQYVDGGTTEGSTTPVHQEELQPVNSPQSNVQEPQRTV